METVTPTKRDEAMNGAEDSGAYVKHLQHEHHQLNQLLLEIGQEVAELVRASRPGVTFEHLSQRFVDLREKLQSHFTEEETGGCLEEAVFRCPSLGENSKMIVAEHALLDRMLEQLVTQTRNPKALSADVQHSYQAFAEKLQAHEAAETRLLRMAFGEAADYDVEGID